MVFTDAGVTTRCLLCPAALIADDGCEALMGKLLPSETASLESGDSWAFSFLLLTLPSAVVAGVV